MTQIYVTMDRLDYFERGRELYKGKRYEELRSIFC